MSHTFIDDECALPLFAAARSRRNDPFTSVMAAASAECFAGEHCRMIADALREGPAGKCEIARRCGLTEQQVNRRLAVMRRAGLISRTGRCVPSDSGRLEHEHKLGSEHAGST
jgi:transcription initiation factor IIE alpha subunit